MVLRKITNLTKFMVSAQQNNPFVRHFKNFAHGKETEPFLAKLWRTCLITGFIALFIDYESLGNYLFPKKKIEEIEESIEK